MMRPENFSGDGTLSDLGTYDTHGETKCGSVVAAAIASAEPGSGTSGACAAEEMGNAAMNANERIDSSARRYMWPLRGQPRRKSTTRKQAAERGRRTRRKFRDG